ncbi:MAG: hypothetical protein K6T90_20110 [Leptolyngbyaceae cyanobacterium HOT.MB2.61]|nr:hypothetical protein [Leptolyngbyaceae cyanobacterium HOT.MB2.61]
MAEFVYSRSTGTLYCQRAPTPAHLDPGQQFRAIHPKTPTSRPNPDPSRPRRSAQTSRPDPERWWSTSYTGVNPPVAQSNTASHRTAENYGPTAQTLTAGEFCRWAASYPGVDRL